MNALPEDIVELIITFACDRRGYNSIEYEKRKRSNRHRMKRILLELKCWKKMDVSISWLRPVYKQSVNEKNFKKSLKDGNPRVFYNKGFYYSIFDELITLNEEYSLIENDKIIEARLTYPEYESVINHPFDKVCNDSFWNPTLPIND